MKTVVYLKKHDEKKQGVKMQFRKHLYMIVERQLMYKISKKVFPMKMFDDEDYNLKSELRIRMLVEKNPEMILLEKKLRDLDYSHSEFVEEIISYCVDNSDDKEELYNMINCPDATAMSVFRLKCKLEIKRYNIVFDKQAYDAESEKRIRQLVGDSIALKSLEEELRSVQDAYPVFVEGEIRYCKKYPEDMPIIIDLVRRPNITTSDILREKCLLDEKHHVNDGYYGDNEDYED